MRSSARPDGGRREEKEEAREEAQEVDEEEAPTTLEAPPRTPSPPPDGKEDLSLLFYSLIIHTVSHKDLYVTLESRPGAECDAVARPAFSSFRKTTGRIMEELRKQRDAGVLRRVRFSSERTAERVIPVGYRPDEPIEFDEWGWDDFRVKSRFRNDVADRPRVTGVFFPLQAVLLPRWLDICDTKAGDGTRRMMLVSGSGMPWNRGHDAEANSTHLCAQLINEFFVREFYPEVTAEVVNSSSNIFTYDDSVRFVTDEVRPRVDRLRGELAQRFYEFWPQRMHVTLSLSGGVPAEVSSISACLRSYRPDCLHIWQLKSFWHAWPTSELCEDELEFHPFEKLEVEPATAVASLRDPKVCRLAEEMALHKVEFEAVRDSGRYHELELFWLRKSKKSVLSVLMVQKRDDQEPKFYRGVNLEVSMPTGSLCSERNAVGSALAHDPSLTRKDMKMIAVLSLPLKPSAKRPFVPPPPSEAGADKVRRPWHGSTESLPEAGAASIVISSSDDEDNEGGDGGAAGRREADEGAAAAAALARARARSAKESQVSLRRHPRAPTVSTPRSYRSAANLHEVSPMLASRPGSPRPGGGGDGGVGGAGASAGKDLNPMDPCGACNEWLKKIAEVNPDFRVVTFTSADADAVYVKGVR